MKQSIFTLALSLFVALHLCAQTPQFINFQAVARDNSGNPIISQGNVNVTFTIKNGNQTIYSESQTASTDACGMFSLKIGTGNGSPISFGQINWSSNDTKFLEVKVNGTVIGDQQMVSVPYALYAEKTKLQQGVGISITGSEIANSGDLSNTNELQTISFNSNNNTVSLSQNGGSFQLPSSNVTIQQGNGITVAQNGSNYTISNNGDSDNNASNELQSLSFNSINNTVSLSQNGGSFQLPAAPIYVPQIAIFEESKPWQGQPPAVASDNSWHKRILSNTVLSSNFVSLNGPNLQFSATGTYLISASAPAFKSRRHKLCLREAGTEVIKIIGTSEDTEAIPRPDGGAYGVVTRSIILGTLQVTNINTQYYLDHWLEMNTGGGSGLGVESAIPNTTIAEVYSQIMIQKIQ